MKPLFVIFQGGGVRTHCPLLRIPSLQVSSDYHIQWQLLSVLSEELNTQTENFAFSTLQSTVLLRVKPWIVM